MKSPDTPSPPRLPELLLPAGSFAAGVAAFEGGADAIYLGFADYSARKQARNFSPDEYRRILGFARSGKKRVYVTVNTVLLDEEFEELAAFLAFLSRFAPDALIIQDWGLAAMVRQSFPGLPLHASTQTAIQSPEAALLAAEAGISRVVLPRECGPLELADFQQKAPGLEFEVFVHGALCYSYSGLCLASGTLLGRSGNRGECAQLCRSYYEAPAWGGKAYWFSCKDLNLEERLADFVAAGAASFKVEGRMKSPEYVHAVARLYRGALDRLAGAGPDEAEMELRRRAARLGFSRAPTPGWAAHHAGSDLLDFDFPGHRGIPIGTVLSARRGSSGNQIEVEIESELGQRDGLQALLDAGEAAQPGAERRLPEAVAFSANEMRDAQSGRQLFKARAGSRLFLASPRLLPAGTRLDLISARALDRREPSLEEYPPLVSEVPVELSLSPEARLRLSLTLPRFDAESGDGEKRCIEDSEPLPLALSSSPGGFDRAIRLFGESGERDFRFIPAVAPEARFSLSEGAAPQSLADLFIPPSLLKKAKNRLYELAALCLAEAEEAKARAAIAALGQFPAARAASCPSLPPRRFLRFERKGLAGGLPFCTARVVKEGQELPAWEGWRFLPLAPLVQAWEAYAKLLIERIDAESRRGERLMIGLGALHHAAFARELASRFPEAVAAGRLAFFADIHCSIANRSALAAWASFVPGLAAAYAWIEAEEPTRTAFIASMNGEGRGLPLLYEAGEDWNVPLFMSKGCLLRHGPGSGHCPSPCARLMTSTMSDRKRSYVVLVEDCITWLFERRPETPNPA